MSYFHIPVLSNEIIETINPKSGENLVDGTVGGGGHAEAILKKTAPDGKLLGIDLDREAMTESKRKLKKYSKRIILTKGNYTNFVEIGREYNFHPVDIFFLDLGISSQQLNSEALGISFLKNAPLDMRMGGDNNKINNYETAEQIINNWSEDKIESILKNYGEERYAKNIASKIIEKRKIKRIVNTQQLVEVISEAVSGRYKNQRIHFATRTFQALRIAVNGELENLEAVLPRVLEKMEVGGRIAIISFHSLEDRIVKHFFRKESKDCICDSEVPVCICNHKKRLEIITKKPIIASKEEILKNPRSRSAKLRVAKKIL
ncbi:MAG: 16S rRNA (cytosine(1402)-N(4))-methyltransferase RsmH [Patescibacteria group bacterium]|nr:16S rRNA (cytosine(1402)-N(4))-methyltransferase RsmH [Patescibacteria group bacterium]